MYTMHCGALYSIFTLRLNKACNAIAYAAVLTLHYSFGGPLDSVTGQYSQYTQGPYNAQMYFSPILYKTAAMHCNALQYTILL